MKTKWKIGCRVRHKDNPTSVWTVSDVGEPNGLFWALERSQGMSRNDFEVIDNTSDMELIKNILLED